MNASARERVINLDYWSSHVEPIPLDGGITNTNFIVDDLLRRFAGVDAVLTAAFLQSVSVLY